MRTSARPWSVMIVGRGLAPRSLRMAPPCCAHRTGRKGPTYKQAWRGSADA
jgi:hypothetical protein